MNGIALTHLSLRQDGGNIKIDKLHMFQLRGGLRILRKLQLNICTPNLFVFNTWRHHDMKTLSAILAPHNWSVLPDQKQLDDRTSYQSHC